MSCLRAGWHFDRFFGEPVETITKSATREFTGTRAEETAQRLAFYAGFPGNFAASQVLRESSEAPKSVVTATAGSVHGAGTLSSPIADQPASIQPGCILAGWTYAIPRLRFDGTFGPERPTTHPESQAMQEAIKETAEAQELDLRNKWKGVFFP